LNNALVGFHLPDKFFLSHGYNDLSPGNAFCYKIAEDFSMGRAF